MNSTLNVLLFLLRLRHRRRVSVQPSVGNLFDNTEQNGNNYHRLQGLSEHDEENCNGEHVRHDCLEDVAGENEGGAGRRAKERSGRWGGMMQGSSNSCSVVIR